MKMLWCWRCKSEMPMLDESEFAEISELHSQCMRDTKEFRQRTGIPVAEICFEERFRPVLQRYQQLTGFSETNINAIMHHRLLLYGPPCKQCGKPLRRPNAKLCGACMFPVYSTQ